ncbi:MAG: hypothetical protein ABIN97_16070 [Ginsengibacter sp.]
MAVTILNIILTIIAIYLACGFVFAIPFVVKGANKIDEGAHGATWGFRLIIMPATIVLWPVLLKKWMGVKTPPNLP